MDLKAIRDHLCLARIALGTAHPVSSRIKTVEKNLTPGDPFFRNDAVSAETDLLAISTEFEQLYFVSDSEGIAERDRAEVPAGVDDAVKQILNAIELL